MEDMVHSVNGPFSSFMTGIFVELVNRIHLQGFPKIETMGI